MPFRRPVGFPFYATKADAEGQTDEGDIVTHCAINPLGDQDEAAERSCRYSLDSLSDTLYADSTAATHTYDSDVGDSGSSGRSSRFPSISSASSSSATDSNINSITASSCNNNSSSNNSHNSSNSSNNISCSNTNGNDNSNNSNNTSNDEIGRINSFRFVPIYTPAPVSPTSSWQSSDDDDGDEDGCSVDPQLKDASLPVGPPMPDVYCDMAKIFQRETNLVLLADRLPGFFHLLSREPAARAAHQLREHFLLPLLRRPVLAQAFLLWNHKLRQRVFVPARRWQDYVLPYFSEEGGHRFSLDAADIREPVSAQPVGIATSALAKYGGLICTAVHCAAFADPKLSDDDFTSVLCETRAHVEARGWTRVSTGVYQLLLTSLLRKIGLEHSRTMQHDPDHFFWAKWRALVAVVEDFCFFSPLYSLGLKPAGCLVGLHYGGEGCSDADLLQQLHALCAGDLAMGSHPDTKRTGKLLLLVRAMHAWARGLAGAVSGYGSAHEHEEASKALVALLKDRPRFKQSSRKQALSVLMAATDACNLLPRPSLSNQVHTGSKMSFGLVAFDAVSEQLSRGLGLLRRTADYLSNVLDHTSAYITAMDKLTMPDQSTSGPRAQDMMLLHADACMRVIDVNIAQTQRQKTMVEKSRSTVLQPMRALASRCEERASKCRDDWCKATKQLEVLKQTLDREWKKLKPGWRKLQLCASQTSSQGASRGALVSPKQQKKSLKKEAKADSQREARERKTADRFRAYEHLQAQLELMHSVDLPAILLELQCVEEDRLTSTQLLLQRYSEAVQALHTPCQAKQVLDRVLATLEQDGLVQDINCFVANAPPRERSSGRRLPCTSLDIESGAWTKLESPDRMSFGGEVECAESILSPRRLSLSILSPRRTHSRTLSSPRALSPSKVVSSPRALSPLKSPSSPSVEKMRRISNHQLDNELIQPIVRIRAMKLSKNKLGSNINCMLEIDVDDHRFTCLSLNNQKRKEITVITDLSHSDDSPKDLKITFYGVKQKLLRNKKIKIFRFESNFEKARVHRILREHFTLVDHLHTEQSYLPSPLPVSTETTKRVGALPVAAVAVQLHELWITNKKARGWQYGDVLDMDKKTHPHLCHFDKTSDEAQTTCLGMVTLTMAGILELGFCISQAPYGTTASSSDLSSLVEFLAENAHEVRSASKYQHGLRCGPTTDSLKELHSSLLPYTHLDEADKEEHREAAVTIITALVNLGFDIKAAKPILSPLLTAGLEDEAALSPSAFHLSPSLLAVRRRLSRCSAPSSPRARTAQRRSQSAQPRLRS